LIQRFNIDKIGISAVNLAVTIDAVKKAYADGDIGYICVTNSRTCYIANRDEDYCRIQNDSLVTIPDGMPLVWIARLNGFKEVNRVSGIDLLRNLLGISTENNFSHYFFGSKPETISLIEQKLLQEYPSIDIRGIVSPPFQPIEKFNIQQIADEINRLEPTFFWCGLGAPKQEFLISSLQPRLKNTICIGVGLAFDYFAGTVKRAPSWMRRNGLEGIYRLIQQPGRINYKSIIALSSIIPFILKPLTRKILFGSVGSKKHDN